VDRYSIVSQLIRVDEGMIHLVPKVQRLMKYEDVPSSSERVTPCGRDSGDGYVV